MPSYSLYPRARFMFSARFVRKGGVVNGEELTEALCGGTLVEVVDGGASLTS